MSNFQVNSIGVISVSKASMSIQLNEKYVPALEGLDGFGHIAILYWCNQLDTPEMRTVLTTPKPYAKAPETLGIFATRSPLRPNPIALSVAEVIHLDSLKGRIELAYIDALDGSPILDIKPYTPSADRIEHPIVPEWCSHWPNSYETSEHFNWEAEFLF